MPKGRQGGRKRGRGLPGVCSFYYSSKGCTKGDECYFLHICRALFDAEGCSFGEHCPHNHYFTDYQTARVLKEHNIDPRQHFDVLLDLLRPQVARGQSTKDGGHGKEDEEDSDVFTRETAASHGQDDLGPSLRLPTYDYEEEDDGDEVTSNVSSNSQKSGTSREQRRRPHGKGQRKSSTATSEVSETSEPQTDASLQEICTFHVKSQCRHGDKCSKLHRPHPYQWQLLRNNKWINFDSKLNGSIEASFCNPSVLEMPIKLGKVSFTIEFDTMTMLRPKSYDFQEIRRLATMATVVNHIKTMEPYCTHWVWYWEDHQGRWKEYSKQTSPNQHSITDSNALEKAYQKYLHHGGSATYAVSSPEYCVKFDDMIQTVARGNHLKVCRRPKPFTTVPDVKPKHDMSHNLGDNDLKTGSDETRKVSPVVPGTKKPQNKSQKVYSEGRGNSKHPTSKAAKPKQISQPQTAAISGKKPANIPKLMSRDSGSCIASTKLVETSGGPTSQHKQDKRKSQSSTTKPSLRRGNPDASFNPVRHQPEQGGNLREKPVKKTSYEEGSSQKFKELQLVKTPVLCLKLEGSLGEKTTTRFPNEYGSSQKPLKLKAEKSQEHHPEFEESLRDKPATKLPFEELKIEKTPVLHLRLEGGLGEKTTARLPYEYDSSQKPLKLKAEKYQEHHPEFEESLREKPATKLPFEELELEKTPVLHLKLGEDGLGEKTTARLPYEYVSLQKPLQLKAEKSQEHHPEFEESLREKPATKLPFEELKIEKTPVLHLNLEGGVGEKTTTRLSSQYDSSQEALELEIEKTQEYHPEFERLREKPNAKLPFEELKIEKTPVLHLRLEEGSGEKTTARHSSEYNSSQEPLELEIEKTQEYHPEFEERLREKTTVGLPFGYDNSEEPMELEIEELEIEELQMEKTPVLHLKMEEGLGEKTTVRLPYEYDSSQKPLELEIEKTQEYHPEFEERLREKPTAGLPFEYDNSEEPLELEIEKTQEYHPEFEEMLKGKPAKKTTFEELKMEKTPVLHLRLEEGLVEKTTTRLSSEYNNSQEPLEMEIKKTQEYHPEFEERLREKPTAGLPFGYDNSQEPMELEIEELEIEELQMEKTPVLHLKMEEGLGEKTTVRLPYEYDSSQKPLELKADETQEHHLEIEERLRDNPTAGVLIGYDSSQEPLELEIEKTQEYHPEFEEMLREKPTARFPSEELKIEKTPVLHLKLKGLGEKTIARLSHEYDSLQEPRELKTGKTQEHHQAFDERMRKKPSTGLPFRYGSAQEPLELQTQEHYPEFEERLREKPSTGLPFGYGSTQEPLELQTQEHHPEFEERLREKPTTGLPFGYGSAQEPLELKTQEHHPEFEERMREKPTTGLMFGYGSTQEPLELHTQEHDPEFEERVREKPTTGLPFGYGSAQEPLELQTQEHHPEFEERVREKPTTGIPFGYGSTQEPLELKTQEHHPEFEERLRERPTTGLPFGYGSAQEPLELKTQEHHPEFEERLREKPTTGLPFGYVSTQEPLELKTQEYHPEFEERMREKTTAGLFDECVSSQKSEEFKMETTQEHPLKETLGETPIKRLSCGGSEERMEVEPEKPPELQEIKKQPVPSVPKLEKVVRSKSASALSNEICEICAHNMRDKCKDGDNCCRLHTQSPYQWQYKTTSRWRDFGNRANTILEKTFSEPSEDEPARVLEQSQNTREQHFEQEFKSMIVSNDCVQGDSIRRLSTMSTVKCLSPWLEPFCIEWLWYWKDEYGNWIQYAQKNSKDMQSDVDGTTLEIAYEDYLGGYGDSIYPFYTHKNNYHLNFETMVQRNLDLRYGTEREVRRRPKFMTMDERHQLASHERFQERKQDIPDVPKTWDKRGMKYNDSPRLIRLGVLCHSEEYMQVADLFWNTMDDKNGTIIAIKRVQNLELWEDFSKKRERMTKKNGRPVLEKQLWHGTKQESAVAICRQNFDFRINVTHRFGQGSYFARDASYSNRYGIPENGICRMFLVRVLVGSFVAGESEYKRPPPKDPDDPLGDLHDSCVNNVIDPSVYVIFDKSQYYPEYLIEYCRPQTPDAATGRPSAQSAPTANSATKTNSSKESKCVIQ